jgi:hypothetical protein
VCSRRCSSFVGHRRGRSGAGEVSEGRRERLGGEAARPGDKKISMQYPAVDSWYRVRDIGDDECGKIGTAL